MNKPAQVEQEAKVNNGITPSGLSNALVKIVSEEAGCPAAWSQHPGALTSEELYKIRSRIEMLLRRAVTETTDHEIGAGRVRE